MKYKLDERFFLLEDDQDDLILDNPDDETDGEQPNQEAENSASKSQQNNITDWAVLYDTFKKEGKKDELFWYGDKDPRLEDDDSIKLGFFKSVYKDEADRVTRIGDAVAMTYAEYGWDKNTNPFIGFINLLLNKSINNLDLESLTTGDLVTLIKLFEDDLIDEDDLAGKGDLAEYNLIYNRNFWKKTSFSDKKELIQLQNNYVRHNQGKNDLDLRFANIYSQTGSQDVSKPDLAIKPGGELRNLKEIKRILKVKSKEKLTNDQVNTLVSNIKDPDTALAVFIYAYDALRVISENGIIAANKKYKNLFDKLRSQKDCERLSNVNYKAAEKLLKLTSRTYSANQVVSLLKSLVDIARPGFLPEIKEADA